MKRRIFLGIDLGTTVLKAAAFDGRTGDVLASSSKRLTIRLTKDGGREQSAGSIDRAIASLPGWWMIRCWTHRQSWLSGGSWFWEVTRSGSTKR